uniref:BSD2 cysteine rich domain-containing protein n=1 Tax=Davidia involucrata TaxID=16924 RepID=A0A5B7C572_DAVIN
MAISPRSVPMTSFITAQKPGLCVVNSSNQKLLGTVKFFSVKAKAADSDQRTKVNSVICADCDGNGAVLCSQCKGSGVNSVDYFDGQFKAGESCWLCGGKKDMLCGNCNGAGFVGGFMSTFDN